MVGGQRWPETLVAEQTEVVLGWATGVAFQNIIPLLCRSRHVEGCEPNLVRLTGKLVAEEGLANGLAIRAGLLYRRKWGRTTYGTWERPGCPHVPQVDGAVHAPS